jgi:hypothetical protein
MKVFNRLLFLLLIVSCKSSTPGVSDSSVTTGFIFIVLIFGTILGFGLWYELIDKPREERERFVQQKIEEEEEKREIEIERVQFEEFKKDRKFYNSLDILLNNIDKLSVNTPPCNKCGEEIYTLWDLNKNTLTIRCNGCKKKFVIGNDSISTGFVSKLDESFNIYISLLKNPNRFLNDFKNHDFKFSSLRMNTPLCRGIEFESSGGEIESLTIERNESRRISQDVKDKVWRRDEGKCVNCGSNEKLEFDHIIPFSKGGSNTYRNIQLLCEKCNREKSVRLQRMYTS